MKGVVLGAGIGMIFGAALGAVGTGLVLGAAAGLVLDSRRNGADVFPDDPAGD